MAKVKKLELEKQEWIPFCTITLSKREAHALREVTGSCNGMELSGIWSELSKLDLKSLPDPEKFLLDVWNEGNGLDEKLDKIYGKGTK